MSRRMSTRHAVLQSQSSGSPTIEVEIIEPSSRVRKAFTQPQRTPERLLFESTPFGFPVFPLLTRAFSSKTTKISAKDLYALAHEIAAFLGEKDAFAVVRIMNRRSRSASNQGPPGILSATDSEKSWFIDHGFAFVKGSGRDLTLIHVGQLYEVLGPSILKLGFTDKKKVQAILSSGLTLPDEEIARMYSKEYIEELQDYSESELGKKGGPSLPEKSARKIEADRLESASESGDNENDDEENESELEESTGPQSESQSIRRRGRPRKYNRVISDDDDIADRQRKERRKSRLLNSDSSEGEDENGEKAQKKRVRRVPPTDEEILQKHQKYLSFINHDIVELSRRRQIALFRKNPGHKHEEEGSKESPNIQIPYVPTYQVSALQSKTVRLECPFLFPVVLTKGQFQDAIPICYLE